MNLLKMTGGARIGMANATWPFATLTVTNDRLDLNASIIGNYSFTKDDIISIEPYYLIPFFGQGIKINHQIPKYKDKVIFWTFKNPNFVINEIKQTGFFDSCSLNADQDIKNQVIERQKQGGFPVRIPAVIAINIAWNIFFLIDILSIKTNDIPLGKGAAIALGFILLISVLSLISNDFRKLILKDGHDIKEISKFLYFLIFLCGFMLFGLIMMHSIKG